MKLSDNLVKTLMERVTDPQKTAYELEDQCLSYEQLYRETGHIAQYLKSIHVDKGDRVLVMLLDTPAFVESFLACLWIGAIPVPTNPNLGESSLQHIISDSGAKTIIHETTNQAVITDTLKQMNKDAYVLTVVNDIYQNEPCVNSRLQLSDAFHMEPNPEFYKGADQHFWQYTSGTTGSPKAVRHHSHGMLKNAVYYGKQIIDLDESDRIYSTAKMFFGYGLGNSLFFTLYHQATAYLDYRWPKPEYILENIRAFSPSIFFSVPTLYNSLSLNGEVFKFHCPDTIRLVSAGSPLPARTFVLWRERYNLEVLDGIGATEAGHIFVSNRPGKAKPGVTGVPVPGYEVKLEPVDLAEERDSDLEKGVLLVKGPTVSLGYHNNDAKNLERFFNGWYRTGDIFARNKTGEYTYLCREDDAFKLNGQWVVPHNIEQYVLDSFPAVRQCALVPRYVNDNISKTVLFLVADTSKQSKQAIMNEINEVIMDYFPKYMAPAAYYFQDNLPTNDNGKVIRSEMVSIARNNAASQDDDSLLFILNDIS